MLLESVCLPMLVRVTSNLQTDAKASKIMLQATVSLVSCHLPQEIGCYLRVFIFHCYFLSPTTDTQMQTTKRSCVSASHDGSIVSIIIAHPLLQEIGCR